MKGSLRQLTAHVAKPVGNAARPEIGVFNTDYLVGPGALDDRMLILVDFDMLMSSTEMELIEQLAA